MILCACGCGGEVPIGKRKDRQAKYINGHQSRGRLMGNLNPATQKHVREKISSSMKGKHNSPKTEFKKGENMGKNHPRYVGGRKITAAKSHAKRDRGLGFISLNECKIDGWEGHHLNKDYVIYIPKELHHSIYHNIWTNQNMDDINFIVLQWYVLYYGLI